MTTISENLGQAHSETRAAQSVWQYEKFASVFRSVLQERVNRAVVSGLKQEDVTHCAEAVEIIDRAIQMQNIDLILTCHQYLINASLPAAVDVAYHVLKPMVNDRKVSSAITKEHIAFCETVIPLFPFEYGISTDECYAVIALAFEDLNRGDEIIALLGQGVTEQGELRPLLAAANKEPGKLPRH